MYLPRALLAVLAWPGLLSACLAQGQQNPIYQELMTRGVQMGNVAVSVPRPTLADGLSPQQEQQAVQSITDATHTWQALTRNSIVAPFVLKISNEPAAGAVRPRRVDLWFVAYGDLNKLSNEALLRQKANEEAGAAGAASDEGHLLSAAEVQARGIAPQLNERYAAGRFVLFDRVQISGVMRSMLTRGEHSVIAAGLLDARFDADRQYPNAWRPMARDASGQTRPGALQPYTGAGWYAKATRLAEPSGAMLVEVHGVFDEPQGWFGGANLLRSKLPILVQDNVRKFRRELKAESEPAAK